MTTLTEKARIGRINALEARRLESADNIFGMARRARPTDARQRPVAVFMSRRMAEGGLTI